MPDYTKNFLISMNGYTSLNGDPDPKPKNPSTAGLNEWMKLKQKYGGDLPKLQGGNPLDKRMEWIDWANKALPTSGTPAELSAKAAQAAGFDNPGLLLSSSLEEGVGFRYKPDQSYSNAYAAANEKGELQGFPVDAFRNYGLDQIGARVDEFIQKGYLPKDFKAKMKTFDASNELDEKDYYQKAYNAIKKYEGLGDDFSFAPNKKTYDKIDKILDDYEVEGVPEIKKSARTAAFVDDESAFMAKAAFLRAEQDSVMDYAKQKGYSLTPQEKDFFTLASYNGGYGNAQKMLDYYASKKLLGNNGFLKDRISEKGQIYDNILSRFAGARLFNQEGYFNNKTDTAKK